MRSKGVVPNVFMRNSIPPNNRKIQSCDKEGVSKVAAQVERLSGGSSIRRRRVKPFTLYHTSKRLTFTTALQLRAGKRLKCGGLGGVRKKTLKSLSGSTWLTDVKIVGKRKPTAASITQGDKQVSKMSQRFFSLSFFFRGSKQLSTCNGEASRAA